MNLLSPSFIKNLFSRHDAAPLKRFGQNFLINPGVLKKIIEAADLDRGDTVLEIGPGIGTLTQELAKHAKKVIAIEKDRKMVEILKETMAGFKNIEIINADILKLKFFPLFSKEGEGEICISDSNSKSPLTPLLQSGESYKLVANLPYYITSPVIRKFLESENPPKEMVLMVQKEVAQRICAKPPNMSLLAVSVQFYADAKIISYVSKGSFWPSPKVDSAILRITPHKENLPQPLPVSSTGQALKEGSSLPSRFAGASARRVGRVREDLYKNFFKIVRAGFSAPRKQLAGNLAKGLKMERQKIEEALRQARIDPSQRAETLSVKDWIELVKKLDR